MNKFLLLGSVLFILGGILLDLGVYFTGLAILVVAGGIVMNEG